tara:strand:+ start:103 stop:996 length:894 start_codon:yes stop_codon:yes gene_type:complete
MESPRIAADEAWEGEVAPESAAAPEPAEERPSMLSRLASWRAPEPEPEMERDGKTEAPAPPEPAEEAPRQLHCDHFYCRAPPGPLGLAFKDSTRVVGGLLPPYTSVLCGTVYPGDELVSVNDCVVADDVLGVLAAQDDGATERTLVFSRASWRRPEDYYAVYAPPGKLGIAFENDARRLAPRPFVKGNGYEPGFVVGRVDPASALRGVVAEGDVLLFVNGVPCDERAGGPLRALAQPSSAAYPRRRLVFARKGFREYSERDDWKSCGAICCEICSCGGPSPDDEYGTTMYDGNDYTY